MQMERMSFTGGKLFHAGRRVFRGYVLVMALVILAVLILPFFAPNDPYKAQFLFRLKPPSLDYPLGTDALGRCVLSRLMYGARLTTASALAVVMAASLIGSLIGTLAGMVGGIVDRAIMRFCEGMSVFPALAICMIIAGTLGLGLQAVIIALITVHWTDYARVVRNAVIVERTKPYVMAAEALGARHHRIAHRHIFPNIIGPLLTLAAYSMSWAILAFAGLSFLGLGVEPGTPEWGLMIAESRNYLRDHPRLVLAPGLTIAAFVVAVNLLGDMLGDRFRLRQINYLH
ncbi:ABC transporter permease subunit [Thalassospira sp.]|uniref:ABC transporter permease n=1 Tax=Thalassospira sp. TaxID=1912094 RepID=UPI0025FB79CE|nr:ABC transporter permease subunit [Thalassospira sp.]|tara:strand:+ start:3882 stop:4742 length:861 start_codon:yes stop_codon:yes gene_type:complete